MNTREGETRNAAIGSIAGDRLLVYLSGPATVSLRLGTISVASKARATWVHPQTGERSATGEFPTTETPSFSPPKDWPDTLLLLETI
jgi:hypothetical protein